MGCAVCTGHRRTDREGGWAERSCRSRKPGDVTTWAEWSNPSRELCFSPNPKSQGHCRCDQVKRWSHWSRMSPNAVRSVLIKRGKCGHRPTEKRKPHDNSRNRGDVSPSQGTLRTASHRQTPGKGREEISFGASKENQSCQPFHSGLLASRTGRKSTLLILRLPAWGTLRQQPHETNPWGEIDSAQSCPGLLLPDSEYGLRSKFSQFTVRVFLTHMCVMMHLPVRDLNESADLFYLPKSVARGGKKTRVTQTPPFHQPDTFIWVCV